MKWLGNFSAIVRKAMTKGTRRVARSDRKPIETRERLPKPDDKDPVTIEEATAYIKNMQPVLGNEGIAESADRIRKLANAMLIVGKDMVKNKNEPISLG